MLESLIASIREHGVLEPILVRPLGGRGFEVVAGERRLRAARLAGLEVIPAVVREMDDSTAAALAADRATGELPKPHAPAPKSGIRPDPPAGGPTTVARAFDAGRPRSVTNGTYMPPAVVTRREPRVISGPGIPGPGAFEPADGGAGMPGEVPVAAGDERSRRPRFRFAPFPFLRRERGSSERQR